MPVSGMVPGGCALSGLGQMMKGDFFSVSANSSQRARQSCDLRFYCFRLVGIAFEVLTHQLNYRVKVAEVH
jgi:hypothetical protein